MRKCVYICWLRVADVMFGNWKFVAVWAIVAGTDVKDTSVDCIQVKESTMRVTVTVDNKQ